MPPDLLAEHEVYDPFCEIVQCGCREACDGTVGFAVEMRWDEQHCEFVCWACERWMEREANEYYASARFD